MICPLDFDGARKVLPQPLMQAQPTCHAIKARKSVKCYQLLSHFCAVLPTAPSVRPQRVLCSRRAPPVGESRPAGKGSPQHRNRASGHRRAPQAMFAPGATKSRPQRGRDGRRGWHHAGRRQAREKAPVCRTGAKVTCQRVLLFALGEARRPSAVRAGRQRW